MKLLCFELSPNLKKGETDNLLALKYRHNIAVRCYGATFSVRHEKLRAES